MGGRVGCAEWRSISDASKPWRVSKWGGFPELARISPLGNTTLSVLLPSVCPIDRREHRPRSWIAMSRDLVVDLCLRRRIVECAVQVSLWRM